MIERIDGIVHARIDTRITLQIGGFYLSMQVPRAHEVIVENAISLHTELIWNQETGPQLFGFITLLDRTVFNLLIECSGIGPKIAIAALEQLGAEAIVHALYEGTEKILSSVSGIGTKKAEYMIVHLKHKAGKLITSGIIGSHSGASQLYELDFALQSLNYSRGEIHRTLEHLKHFPKTETTPITFDILLRRALSYLAHKQ